MPDKHQGANHLPLEALEASFHLFTQSLYSLLSLPLNPPYIVQPLPPSPLIPPSPFLTPLSPWQVEQVYRQRTHENAEEARKTLKGIVRLVSKIKEMKVGEGVRGKVLRAVESLEQVSAAAYGPTGGKQRGLDVEEWLTRSWTGRTARARRSCLRGMRSGLRTRRSSTRP